MPTAVVRYLVAHRVPHRLHTHPGLSTVAAVETAAPPFPRENWVKTLVFATPAGPLLVALKAFDDLDYGALPRAAGLRRADIAKAGADDLAALGFAPGGAGPFPLATAARLILDPQVVEPGTIYVGGGQPDVTVEIDPHVLVRQFRPVLAPLSRKRAT